MNVFSHVTLADSHFIFSMRQNHSFKMLVSAVHRVSTRMNTCKLQPMLYLRTHLVTDRAQLGVASCSANSLSHGCYCVCFTLITTSWIPFTDIFTVLPLNPFCFSLFLSVSLFRSQLSALFYKRSSDTVSQRHTFFPSPQPAVRLDLP